MSDGPLLNDVTRAFAEAHRNEDVRDLALKTKRTADLDLPAALDQIAGWQIARNKLPQWAACADIVYPAHISMEQCSSQFTAQYKAEIARRLLRSLPQSAGQTANDVTMTDLTGGFGVDFSYLARGFGHANRIYANWPRTIWRRWASRKHRWCAATASNTYVRWSRRS